MRCGALVVVLSALVGLAAAAEAPAAPRGELLMGTCAQTEPPRFPGEVATIWRHRFATGRTRIIERPDYVGTAPGFTCQSPRVAWAPDGARYGIGGLTGVYVRRPGHRVRKVSERVQIFSWMPGGDSVAVAEFAGTPGEQRVVRDPLRPGRPRALTGPVRMSGRFVVSPSGQTFYYDREVLPESSSEIAFTRRGSARSTRISPGVILHISPDGRHLLASDNAGLWIVRARKDGTRRLLFPIREHGFVITAAWSTDGRWIAVVGARGPRDPHYMRLISSDGRVQRPIDLPDSITWLGSVSWRPQRSG
jgi:hypothetical protein